MPDRIIINGERLWQRIMEMADIGATPAGGSCRVALTEEDAAGRELLQRWCRNLDLDIAVDGMGNLFARRAGYDPNRDPVAFGSHLDTQPHGGRFDGVFGVLAGLEVLETLTEQGIETAAPLELCAWSNEEGARFPPPMVASGVFAGRYDLAFGLSRTDSEGVMLGDALESIGANGDMPCGDHRLGAFIEPHIEQGPFLEREQRTIGVVTGVQGSRWFRATFEGQDAHTGSTPMQGRRDALVGAARFISAVHTIALDYAPNAVATVGRIENEPNSHNTIPGRVTVTVDMRHPDTTVLDEMEQALRDAAASAATDEHLDKHIERIADTRPVAFAKACIDAVDDAAQRCGYPYRRMLSGAGHDACHIAQVSPTAMIFVPCAGGLSHNEAESAEKDDLAAGANVLLHSVLRLADASSPLDNLEP